MVAAEHVVLGHVLRAEAPVRGRIVELEARRSRRAPWPARFRRPEAARRHAPIACIRSAARPTVRYFRPFMSSASGDRLLEPAERLGRHRHGEEALDVDLHDLGLELFEQLLAAAVVDPAETLVGVEAEHRAGAEQRGRLVLAVPVHRSRCGPRRSGRRARRRTPGTDARPRRRCSRSILQPAAGHLVDAVTYCWHISVKMSVAGHERLHLQRRPSGRATPAASRRSQRRSSRLRQGICAGWNVTSR